MITNLTKLMIAMMTKMFSITKIFTTDDDQLKISEHAFLVVMNFARSMIDKDCDKYD